MQSTTSQLEDGGSSGLPPEIQEHIGKQLRHVYGKLLSEPLPDKFGKLLEALSKEAADKTDTSK